MFKGLRCLRLDVCDYENNVLCNLYDNQTDLSGQAYDVFVNTERNGWKELSFAIPSVCYGEEAEPNYRLDYLIADYRIRIITDTETDYYLISEPKVIHNSKSKNVEVTAGHISQLLKTKNLNLEFSDTEGNNVGTAEQLLTTILEGTGWAAGYVEPFLEDDGETVKVRSLVASVKTGAFGLISNLCEKFDAKPIYHGDTCTVDIVALNPFSEVSGSEIPAEVLEGKTVLELNYGRNVANITRTLNTENLVTRLYAYGSYGDKTTGLCSLQNVLHNEYIFVLSSNYSAGTEFKFVDKDGNSHYFTLTADASEGNKLIWSDLDPLSASYVWNDTLLDIYQVRKEPEGSYVELTTEATQVRNDFDYLMDFSYYDSVGLLSESMKLALASYQRTMPEYITASTEAASAFLDSEMELSSLAESNRGFLKLDVSGYSTGSNGEIVLNILNSVNYPGGVIYRSDYDEAKHNYFSWYCAKQMKANGDPVSLPASIVYIIHDTTPVTWEKAYVKLIDGEQKTQDYSAYDAADPQNVTLWLSRSKVPNWSSTDRFYLFSTNSISGKLGVRESELEALQQTLEQATKVVTETHPTYFVWENDPAPATDNVLSGYGWYYRADSTSQNLGNLFFCYGIAGETEWHPVLLAESDPAVENGYYYFNLKTKNLYHGESGTWVNVADSNIVTPTPLDPEHQYHAPDTEAQRLSQSFSKVAYYCRRHDMLYKGIYEKYIYTPENNLPAGNYAFKTDYDFFWAFSTDQQVNAGDDLWIDTVKYQVYQDTDVGHIVTPEAKSFDAVEFPVENELAGITLYDGAIDKNTGVETNLTGYKRTNNMSVHGGVSYSYALPKHSYVVFYDMRRRYVDTTEISGENDTVSGFITSPVRASYMRFVFPSALTSAHKFCVTDWQDKFFVKDVEYTVLHPLTTGGDIYGMHALISAFADTADDCYLHYLADYHAAQQVIKDADAALKNALGDLYREGYWQKNEYVEGDEKKLYSDALDNLKKISSPDASYDIQYLDLYAANRGVGFSVTEDLDDVEWPDIEITDAVHLIDESIDVNCWAFIDTLKKCYDQPWKTQITINTDLSLIAQHSFTDVMTRIAEVVNETHAKQSIYQRASEISGSGKFATDKLEGTIDANRTKVSGGASGWYTDDKGNIVVESTDGMSAMMLTGAGFCLASSRDQDGEWNWRTFGTGNGFTADELVTGEMSAERLTAGSITTDKISASVGQELEIGSNKALLLYATADGFRPAGGLQTRVSDGHGSYVPVGQGDSYIQIAAKDTEAGAEACVNIESGGELNLRGSSINMEADSEMNLISGALYIESGSTIDIQSGSTFTVSSPNFSIDANGNVTMTGTINANTGSIAGFTIGYVENPDHTINHRYISTNNMTSVSSAGSGVYIGTDGVNLGNKLKYVYQQGSLNIDAANVKIGNASGTLIEMDAASGDIDINSNTAINIAAGKTATILGGSVVVGNGTRPFTVGANATDAYIYNGMTSLSDTTHNGVYLGTDGIALGKGLFKVTNAGALTATSATIKGALTATSGRIGAASDGTGGWEIGQNTISSDSGTVVLNSSGDYRFYAGDATAADAEFYVKSDGSIKASSGEVGGWTLGDNLLSSGQDNGYVALNSNTSDTYALWLGNETAANAPFSVKRSGEMKATSGVVGGWTLAADKLSSGSNTTYVALNSKTGNYAVWAGDETASAAPFYVKRDGEIKATSGTVGGWNLGTNRLYSSNVGYDTYTVTGGTYYYFDGEQYVEISSLNSFYDFGGADYFDASDGTGRALYYLDGAEYKKLKGSAYATANSTPTTSLYVALDSGSHSDYAMWAGRIDASNAPFRVKRDGTVTLTKLIALGENGTETSVNLRNYPFWKLSSGATVKSVTVTNNVCTSMTFSNAISGVTQVNFKSASSLTSGWTGNSQTIRVWTGPNGTGNNVLTENGVAIIAFGDNAENYKHGLTSNHYVDVSVTDAANDPAWTISSIRIDGSDLYAAGQDSIGISGSWANGTYTATTVGQTTAHTASTTIELSSSGWDIDPTSATFNQTTISATADRTTPTGVTLTVNASGRYTAGYTSGVAVGAAGVTVSGSWDDNLFTAIASNGQGKNASFTVGNITSTTLNPNDSRWLVATVPVTLIGGGDANYSATNISVNATAAYNAGATAGYNSVTVSSASRYQADSYDTDAHNYTVYIRSTASNGATLDQSFSVNGTEAYNAGYAAGWAAARSLISTSDNKIYGPPSTVDGAAEQMYAVTVAMTSSNIYRIQGGVRCDMSATAYINGTPVRSASGTKTIAV